MPNKPGFLDHVNSSLLLTLQSTPALSVSNEEDLVATKIQPGQPIE